MSQGTIVTIGRQYGSGGRNIGIQLAKELGVPFYDQNILKQAAEESGLCEKILQNALCYLKDIEVSFCTGICNLCHNADVVFT